MHDARIDCDGLQVPGFFQLLIEKIVAAAPHEIGLKSAELREERCL